MVNKVEITPSRIITRDNSGNTTFDTNNLYLKTDPAGTMQLGGFTRLPVYSTYFYYTATGSLNDAIGLGYPMPIVEAHNSTYKLPATSGTGYYSIYIPSGVYGFQQVGSHGVPLPGPIAGSLYYRYNNIGTIYYKANWSDSWTTVRSCSVETTIMVCLIPQGTQQRVPVPTIRYLAPKQSDVEAAYATKGAGYYKVAWLPSGWYTNSYSTYFEQRQNDGSLYTSNTQNRTIKEVITDNFIGAIQGGFVLPKIVKSPTNIAVAVTA